VTGVGLDLRWKKTIGSGYSQVVVDGSQVFVLFTEDDQDVLASLDAGSGDEHWRYTLGTAWRGRQGSLDGPISTPVVDSERLYGLSPYGVLFAVDRSSGKEVWRVDFRESYGSKLPGYGFATSPLLHGETVIVQAGGKGGLVGFDRSTGAEKWKTGWEKCGTRPLPFYLWASERNWWPCRGHRFTPLIP
jgi:outer membrane protein assembly factor BamB